MNDPKETKRRLKVSVYLLVHKVMGLYHKCMKYALAQRWLKVYYKNRRSVVDELANRYFSELNLTEEERTEAAEIGLGRLPRVSQQMVSDVATRMIRSRALFAGFVTFLATLPQNWVMWPMLLVDVIFFQKETFLVIQELEALYGGRAQESGYLRLANMAVRMEGVLAKQKLIGWLKRGFYQVVSRGMRALAAAYRTMLRATVGSAAKWAGIAAGRTAVETTIDYALYFIVALVAGGVSYWLFVPMGRRLERKLKEGPHDSSAQ